MTSIFAVTDTELSKIIKLVGTIDRPPNSSSEGAYARSGDYGGKTHVGVKAEVGVGKATKTGKS